MADLTIDYFGLMREAIRTLGSARIYYQGTVTVASGTVTLANGQFPAWAGQSAINLNGTIYGVASRTSATILVLTDTSLTLSTETPYVLMESSDDDRTTAFTDVDDMINNAYRQFLSEMMGETPPRPWSFISPTASFLTATGRQIYTIPADSEFKTSEWLYRVGTTPYVLTQIQNGQLQSIKGATNGKPRYFCIRPQTTTGAESQEYELEFNCPVDSEYTVTYTYMMQPGRLSPANPKPVGAFGHSETIRAAVMAKVEAYLNCKDQVSMQEYQARLAQSKMLDADTVKRSAVSWPTTAVNPGTYEWFMREAASILGDNPNYVAWDHVTAQRFDSWLQRGYRLFLQPEITSDPNHRGHVWSFTRPLFSMVLNAPYETGTITLVGSTATLTGGTFPTWATECELEIEGQRLPVVTRTSGTVLAVTNNLALSATAVTYRLLHAKYRTTSSFLGIDGPLRYRPDTAAVNSYARVNMVSFQTLQFSRYSNTFITNEPLMAAETVENVLGTSESIKVIEFWPYPVRTIQVEGLAKIQPTIIAPGEYAIGGPSHYETILAAMCAAAEVKRMPDFTAKLMASINRDQSLNSPQTLPLNLNRSYDGWRWDLRGSQGPVYVNGTEVLSRV